MKLTIRTNNPILIKGLSTDCPEGVSVEIKSEAFLAIGAETIAEIILDVVILSTSFLVWFANKVEKSKTDKIVIDQVTYRITTENETREIVKQHIEATSQEKFTDESSFGIKS